MNAVLVNVGDELLEALVREVGVLLGLTLLNDTVVGQGDAKSGVQECQLMQAGSQNIVFIFSCGEYRAVGPESLAGTVDIGGAYALNG